MNYRCRCECETSLAQLICFLGVQNDDDKSATPKEIAVPAADLETDRKLFIDTEESHPSVDSPKIPKTDKSEAADTPLIPDLLVVFSLFMESFRIKYG